MAIVIDKKFQELIPPLRDDERTQLEVSLKETGCLDPLTVWEGHNVLLDGHHRHQICTANSIGFEVRKLPFPDREAAMNWMILNQLGRRNLAPKDAAMLRGKLYNSMKKTKAEAGASKGQSDLCSNTAGQIAKQTGVSEKTVKRDAAYATAAEEQGDEFDKNDSKAETIRKAKVKRGELPAQDEVQVEKSKAPDDGKDASTSTSTTASKDDADAEAEALPAAEPGQQSPATHPSGGAGAESADHAEPEIEESEHFTLSDGSDYVVPGWLDGGIPRRKLDKGLKMITAKRSSVEEAAIYEKTLIEMANAANHTTKDLPKKEPAACAKAAGRMIWDITD